MPSGKKKDIEKSDFIVLQKKLTEKIDKVLSPNKFQVGLDSEGFKSDLLVKGDTIVDGVLITSGGVTGSLTSLIDGTDYIQGGDNIIITTGSTGFIHISAQTGGGNADREAQYVVMAATASMTNERVLAAGSGIAMTDAGAGGNVTLAINYNDIPSLVSGTDFTGGVKFSSNLHISGNVSSFVLTGAIKGPKFHVSASSTLFDSRVHFSGTISEFIATGSGKFETGLSGSLQKLTTGKSYLAAGENIIIDSGTAGLGGQIVISAPGAGAGGADKDAKFLVLELTGSLTNERLFGLSDGLKATDGGAGGNYLLSINENVVAKVASGTTFTDNVHLSGSVSDFLLTGSIKGTQTHISSDSVLIDNNIYLSGNVSDFTATGTIRASSGLQVTSSAYFNDPVYLSGSVSDFTATGTIKAAAGITVSSDASFSGGSIFTGNTHLSGNVSDFSLTGTIKNSAAKVIESSVATEIETTAGALTLDGKAGITLSEDGTTVVSIDTSRNVSFENTGDVIFKNTGGSTSDPDVEFDGYVRFDGHTEFDKAASFDDSVHLSGSVSSFTTTGTIKANAGLEVADSAIFNGSIYLSGNVSGFVATGTAKFNSGLSGSLTALTDGTPYLVAGDNVTLSTGSSGAITINSTGGGGSGGADKGATYVVISATGSLANERVLKADSGLTISDGGAGNEVTLAINTNVVAQIVSGTTFEDNVHFSGSISDFALTGTIKNSASKIIESSVATEIETKAGALTLDGAAGIDLQYSGSTYIALNTGSVYILSGGAAASSPPGVDAAFFVSGSIGGKDSTTKGVTEFGGDTVISGNIHASQYIYHEGDSDTYIRFTDDNVYFAAGGRDMIFLKEDGAQDAVIINDGGVDVDFRVESTSEPQALFVDANANAFHVNRGESNFDTKIHNTNDVAISVGSAGVIFNEDGHATNDFRVESDNQTHAVFVDAGSDQVMLGANSAGGGDTYLFISGSIGAKDSTTKGIAVFGGDSVISGSVTSLKGLSGSLTTLTDGTEYMIAGTNITINTGSDGALTISATTGTADPGGSNTQVQFNDGGAFGGDSGLTFNKTSDLLSAGKLHVTAKTSLSGTVSGFALTGTIKNTASKVIESSVATEIETDAGSLTLDGKTGVNLQANGTTVLSIGPAGTYLSSSVSDFSLTGTIKNSASKVIESSVATEIETRAGTLTLDGAAGIDLQHSGSSYIKLNSGSITIGDLSGSSTLGVAPPDIYISGAVQSELHLSGSVFADKLSGSLTTLADGSEYLIAGSSITLTTGSTGAITIASTATGGGGADKGAQYVVLSATGSLSNERALAAGSGLKLTDGGAGNNITVAINPNVVAQLVSGTTFTGNVHLSGSVSDFALTGTIKNSAAKVIQSSAATEIETTAGALTLDGKTGLNLQANGTTILSVGPAGTYLSSSVSDFSLTGTIKNSASKVIESSVATEIETKAGALTLDGAAGVNLQYSGSSYLKLGSGSIIIGDLSSSNTLGVASPDIYISGAVQSKLHLSGSVFASKLSGSLTTLTDGTEYMIAGTNITINTGSSGALTISATTGTADPGGGNTQVQFNDGGSFGGDSGLTFNKTSNLLTAGKLHTTDNAHLSGSVSDFNLTGTIKNSAAKVIESSVATEIETGAGALTLDGKSGVNLQANGTTVLSIGPAGTYLSSSVSDFALTGTIKNSASKVIESSVATEIETTAGALTLDGAAGIDLQYSGTSYVKLNTGSVYILSGGGATSSPPGTDAAFFVSGAIGSKGGSEKGLALLGGDLVVSGGAYFNVAGGKHSDFRIESDGEDEAFFLDASANTLYINKGATSFTTVIKNTNEEALRVGAGGVIINDYGNRFVDLRVETRNKTHAIFVDSGEDQVLILSGGGVAPADGAFIVSGSIGVKDSTTKGVAVFGGDTVVSGALHVSQGISGSLTTLTDGTEYIIAGTNVTINTGSSGALTISATTGTADPGGSNTQVQFNDGGSFGGDSDLTFNKTSGLLAAGQLHTTGKANFSGSVSDFALTGTIKNSASKVIESSVATEIETAAGLLTLDGKAGVSLQANGTTILSIGPAGTYLSSSVSDFSLTGTIKNSASKVIESSVATEIETAAGALTLDGKTGVALQVNGSQLLSVGPAGVYLSGSISGFQLTGTIRSSISKVIESSVATEIETDAGALTLDGAAGVNLQYSGSSYLKLGSGSIIIGDLSGSNTFGVAPPDIYISGAIQSNLHLSSSVFASKLSGSLTTLADGTEYLIAGTNVTINTGSSGALTISATTGTADPGGGNTQVQFNDGGSFGGDSGLTFNKTSNLLTAGKLHVTAKTSLSGTVSDFALTGTIKNSASKVIESSVATEIETDAGALTLDGKTGVNLQANGTTVLSVGPAGTYLSSSVSDFSLTGTIKNSASKVIESSVATEIETTAGALTLDGKTGINLQEDGTTLIAIDNGQNVIIGTAGKQIQLSGSVSDFNLTGTIKNSASKVIESSVATEIETRAGTLTLDGASGIDLQYSGSSYIKLNSGSITIGDLSGSNTLGVAPPDIYISGTVQSNLHLSGSVFASKLSGSLTALADGTEYLIAGTNVTINTGSSGALTISATTGTADPGGGNTQVQFNDGGSFAGDSDLTFNKTSNLLTAGKLHVTAKTSLSGTVSDFALTGTIKNSASKVIESSVATEIETAAGSLTLDGKAGVSLQANGTTVLSIGPAGTYLSSSVSDFALTGTIKNSASKVIESSVATEIETRAGALTLDGAAGVNLQYSGSSYLKLGSGSIIIGDLSGSNTFGVAPPDIYISGTVQSNLHLSGSVFASKLSGSLTTLTDGTEYLIAGTNVTINTGSSGALTISATTGTADPGGSNTQVQFNDGGSFGGDSGLTFNKTSNLLTAGKLHVTAKTSLSGTVSGFALTGTIKNSASKVIESSVATEIETRAGTLTLDGAAGIDLQYSGTSSVKINTGSVYILSGGGATSSPPGVDTAFFVSGSIGVKGSTTKGIALFGGDTVISGTLVANRSDDGENAAIKIDKDYKGTGDVGSLAGVGEDASGLLVDYDVIGIVASGKTAYHDAISVLYNQDGAAHVGTINATGADIRMTGGTDGIQSMKGVAIKLTGADTNTGIDIQVPDGDTSFIARSGASITDYFKIAVTTDGATTLSTSDGNGSATDADLTLDADGNIILVANGGSLKSGVSGAGQDVIFYGEDADAVGLQWDADSDEHGKLTLGQDNHGVDFQVFGESSNNYLKWDQSADTFYMYVPQGSLYTKGNMVFDIASQGWDFTVNSNSRVGVFIDGDQDQVYILSGGTGTGPTSLDPANSTDLAFFVSGSIGIKDSTTKGVAIFGGDTVVSGVLYAQQGISGSLTTLTDGTEYLIAGTNVTINTGSSGALTISATTGTADPGGGNTQVQFNDGGSFGGDSGLTFNKTSDLLSAGKLHITAKTSLSGTVSDFALTGTIKNTASKVIESSVATEIETAAGALTLDGKAGVNLQANGTTVLSIGPAGTYLSSSVSDFSLTGTIKNSASKVIESSVATEIETKAGALTLDGAAGINLQYSGSSYLKLGSGSIIIGDLSSSNTLGVAPPDIYISGAVQSKLHLSGSVFAGKLSGSLTTLADGTEYMIAGANITINTGSSGALTISTDLSVAGSDTQVQFNDDDSFGGDAGLTFNKTSNLLTAGKLHITAKTSLSGTVSDFALTGTIKNSASKVIESSVATEIETKAGALTLDGAAGINLQYSGSTYITLNTGSVYILSGGGATSSPPGVDTAFFVSGAIGSKGSTTKGTSLFGGDMMVSGTLHVSQGISASNVTTDSGNLTLSTTTSGDVVVQAVAGAVDIDADSGTLSLDGSGGINIGTGGYVDVDFNADALDIDALGTVAIDSLGGLINIGTNDNDFNISIGTQGARTVALGSTDAGIDIDAGVYGIQLDSTGGISLDAADDSNFSTTGILTLSGSQVLILSGATGDGSSADESAASDVAFYVSGTMGSKRTSTRGTSLFGGDMMVSGALHVSQGISGSLTTLANGSEYMIGGANISIATGSDGALTISAPAVASVAGTDTQVQFNDDDSFGGDAGLTFNKTSNLLSAGKLHVTAKTSLSGTVSDFALTGTIKNSAAKVIESSVATEIETAAGALTLDGKTGVALQANGSQLLSVGPAGVYLSGSVSGFQLTGTIRSSISRVIESSVATEIETKAGALTLDGATGINLQYSGSSYLKLGSGSIIIGDLSGSNTFGVAPPDIYISGAIQSNLHLSSSVFASKLSGSLTTLVDGTEYLIAGTNVTINTGSSGALTISATTGTADPGGGNTQVQFNDGGSFGGSSAFTFTGTEVELNAESPKYTLRRGANSQDSKISFEGVAGAVGATITHESGTNDLRFDVFNGSSTEEILRLGDHYGTANRQVIFLSGSGIGSPDMQPRNALDLAFFVSGSIGSKGTTDKGTSVFGGDTVVSGALHVSQGISGSLTTLADGTAYLNAGSNVTITTGSSGQITVAVSSTSNVVFNETPGGSINGSNTAFTLANSPEDGTVMLFVNGQLQASGSGLDYTLSNKTLTFSGESVPQTSDRLISTYSKST